MPKLLVLVLLLTTFSPIAGADTEKLIVVHVRGGSYELLSRYAEGRGDDFLRQQNANGMLRPLLPVENAVTISNIAAFETGTLPSSHGVVGHTFGTLENDFAAPQSGFSVPFESETYWEAAARAGKQILSIGALIGHGQKQAPANVDIITQGQQFYSAELVEVNKGAGPHTIILHDDFGLTYEAENNLLRVSVTGGQRAVLRPGGWFTFNDGVTEEGLNRVRRLQWLEDGRLYVRPAFAHKGGSKSFLRSFDASVGSATGWPNIPYFAAGLLPAETIIDETSAELDLIMRMFEAARDDKAYDLIMLDYPIMDRFGHAFQAFLQSQEPAIKSQYEAVFDIAHKRLSRDLEAIQIYAQQFGYKLIIASGHGFSPVSQAINLNRLLEENGIPSNKNWVVRGFPGKVAAHIYADPTLHPEDQQKWLERAADLFKTLRHPETHTLLTDYVLPRSALGSIGLDHSRAGDLFVMLKPGSVFQAQFRSDRPLFDSPVFKGDHGYSAKWQESLGFVISKDANIKHVTDIAPAAKRILGLQK